MSLRLVFMGTPELACASLSALLEAPNLQVIAAVTQPDRPKGRNLKLSPSPVKSLALEHGLEILQPGKARDEAFIAGIRELHLDLIVVAAYGQILPAQLLELPKYGCLNVHTSLLPRYRGAAPIQWAILNGDRETGITIMQMDAGLDTGSIVSQQSVLIEENDDAQTLHDRLAKLGGSLLVQTIPDYVSGKIKPRPQPTEGLFYARKISKQDGQLDWNRPARELRDQVRGLIPWPVASTTLPHEGSLRIWKAEVVERTGAPGTIILADKSGIVVACGQNALRILELQREGARRLGPQPFLAGCALQPGQRLGP